VPQARTVDTPYLYLNIRLFFPRLASEIDTADRCSQMRATNDKLGERYIIVVARELSKALKGLHDAGIMHRDVKGKF
jgi:serine/threonine protein kinase